jgi:hypothetical protein
MRHSTLAILTFLTLTILQSTLFAPPAYAQYQWNNECFEVVDGDQIATLGGIRCLVLTLLSVAIRLIGLAGFLMLVVGGIKMLVSSGEPKALAAGQQTVTLAIAGIAVAVLSWFILSIIETFTGAPVTQFNINFF